MPQRNGGYKPRLKSKTWKQMKPHITNKKTLKMQGGFLFGLVVFHKEKVARFLADKVLEKNSLAAYDKNTQILMKRGLIRVFERLQNSYKNLPITTKSGKGGIETHQLHKVVNISMQKTGAGSYKPDSKVSSNHLNTLIEITRQFADYLQKPNHSSNGEIPTHDASRYKTPQDFRKSGDKIGYVYFFDKSTSVPVEKVFQQLASPDAGAFDSHRTKLEIKERNNIARKFINSANEYARALSYFILYKHEQYVANPNQHNQRQNYHQMQHHVWGG